jgi:hypothetical protein
VYVHGIAEIADDPLRAQSAGFFFVGIASFDVQQLFFPNGHASSAHPVFTIPGMNMIKIGQRALKWIQPEYQIACEPDPEIDRLRFTPEERYYHGESM